MAHPRQTSPPRHPSEVLPAVPRPSSRAGLAAGVGILLVAVLAGLGYVGGVGRLVTPGDAARTAHDVLASAGVFRVAVVALYLAAVVDVVVACALFRYFGPVDEGLSRLAAWFRLAYSGAFMVSIGHLAGVAHLLDDERPAAVAAAEAQIIQGVEAFESVWNAGLVLLGCHLLVLGHLAWRSTSVPGLIGVLLAIAGAAYLSDSLGPVLVPGYPGDIASFAFVGEFLLGVWLVVRGRRVPGADRRPAPGSELRL